MTRRRSPQWAWGATTLALSGLLAACSGGTSGIQPISQTTTSFPHLSIGAAASSTTSTITDPTEAAILAAYRTAEAVYVAAIDHYPIQPSDPRLAQYMTGAELDSVRIALTKDALAGDYEEGTIDVAPMVASVIGTTATVMDCGLDETVLVNHATGTRLNTPDTQRTQVQATMELVAGTWKLATLETVGTGCIPAGA